MKHQAAAFSSGERANLFLLTAYFLLAMASVTMVKSLQNALYLGSIGFDWQLPMLYIALAFLSGPIVLLYRQLAKRYSHLLITSTTILFFGILTIVFWVSLPYFESWTYDVFYLWGGIFTVLVPTQGWIMAYDFFSPGRARRAFGYLGGGGIIGAALGGAYTFGTAELFSSQVLLLHVFVILLALQVLLFGVCRFNGQGASCFVGSLVDGSSEEPFRLERLFSSRHLTYLAGIVLVAALTTTLIDLQYKWVLEGRYPGSESQLIQFFGGLLGISSVLSALFQLVGTGQVLRRFGVGLALLVLPLAVAVGSLGVFFFAGFWAVVILKIVSSSMRTSIDRTTVELLYVPISGQQSVAIKSFMELVVFRLGDALGALIFLVTVALVIDPIRVVAGLMILAAAAWIFFSREVGEEYVRSLRRSLEFRLTPDTRPAFEIEEATASSTLVEALKSANSNKVHFALQQLMAGHSREESPVFELTDQSGEFPALGSPGFDQLRPAWIRSVEPLIGHSDARVAAAALHVLVIHNVEDYSSEVQKTLRSCAFPEMRYLIYLERYVDDPNSVIEPGCAQRWCQNCQPETARILGRILGKTQNPAYRRIFEDWLDSPDKQFRQAALRGIGHYGDFQYLKKLREHLSFSWSRQAARVALARYGEKVVPHLIEWLRDPNLAVAVKREIPSILVRIESPSSREGLMVSLYDSDPVVSLRGLKGLNKIRSVRELSYTEEAFWPIMQNWAKEYYRLANIDVLANGKTPALRLLNQTVRERMQWTLEKLFRGLELFLPRGDAYFSYLGYTSERRALREHAVELIESRIKGELRPTVIPIFETSDRRELARVGRDLFKLPTRLDDTLIDALYEGDAWLRCCVITAAACQRIPRLKKMIEQSGGDVDPLVRETARWALQSWDNRSARGAC